MSSKTCSQTAGSLHKKPRELIRPERGPLVEEYEDCAGPIFETRSGVVDDVFDWRLFVGKAIDEGGVSPFSSNRRNKIGEQVSWVPTGA